jgi:hypothetical protein
MIKSLFSNLTEVSLTDLELPLSLLTFLVVFFFQRNYVY